MGTPRWAVVCIAFCACQVSGPSGPTAERAHVRSEPSARSCKPEAPLVVEITTRELGNRELEVTARVAPTASVSSFDVRFALPAHASASMPMHARFGATAAGVAREIVARIKLADQRSSSISAIARVAIDGVEMTRTASVAIGLPVPPPRTRTYALPDGELAREVRP
jgi:hypothetical protein